MPWEQEISELLQEANSIAVRFDIVQDLTAAQQSTARNNIGINATTESVGGNDYKIVLSY